MKQEKDAAKEILLDAAYQYSCFGVVRSDTMRKILGEKPIDRKEQLKYWKRHRQVIQKLAVLASRM